MKQKLLKSLSFKISICFLFLITAFIIHSCKKDSTNQSSANITNPAVSQAKQWYESTYPVTTTLNSKQTTQSVNQISNVPFDYTQHLKPDWQHAATYNRLGAAVIEIPLDASSDKVASDFRDMTNNKVIYKQQYSRSTFLLLNYGTGYNAYIMTIIADSTYLKGNLSKLANNTYRKHDADFSGVVMYFTPKGAFVSSFGYYNGKLLPPLAQSNTSGTQAVQSLNTSALKPDEESNCLAWFLDTYVDGELQSSVYLYTTCSQNSSSGGGGGGGENGSGAGTSPAPAPCIPPQSTSTNAVTGHLVIDAPIGSEPPPPSDGGNPAPVNYCKTGTVTQTDTTANPCAQLSQLNAAATNAVITNQNQQLSVYSATDNVEHGFDQNLQSWSAGNGIYLTTPQINASASTPDQMNPPFYWDNVNGYTIGFTHDHPNGTAPSPEDIFSMLLNSQSTTLTSAGQQAVAFYKANVSVTVVTSDNNYVVTINNWSTVQTLYNQYLADPTAFDNKVIQNSTGPNNSYEIAILTAFQGSINLYSNYGTPQSYYPITLSSPNKVSEVPCPTN